MATLIGIVSKVIGQVFVVASDGTRRAVIEGDRLFAGDQLVTGAEGAVAVHLQNGQELTLGRGSSLQMNPQLLVDHASHVNTPEATTPTQAQLSDVERVQKAIAAGDDPTQTAEATAAGPGTPGAPGGALGGGHSFVLLEEVADNAGVQLNHIPFKGNAENMQALMGGHIASASDATGWGPHVESGKLRLLATYGSKRTKRWPQTPTLDELGYQTVSDSPFGVCGPKGMEPAVTRAIHDAFRKAIAEPSVLAIFDKYDQSVIYMNTEQYTKFARESFAAERATIERLGMLNKDG